MKKLFKLGIVFTFVLLLTGCGSTSYLKRISYDEYRELIDNKETFILEVMKNSCTHCSKLKPKLEEISKEYELEIKYIDLDKLSDEDKEKFDQETGIASTPTIVFYKDGSEESISTRIKGNVSEEKIISQFKAMGFIKE